MNTQPDYYMQNENQSPEQQFYQSSLILLEGVIRELLCRIDIIRRYGGQEVIEHCTSRIKSVASLRDKLARQGLPQTAEAALAHIHDAAGVRIVCTFVDDVYRVAHALQQQEDFETVACKDYIRNPKPNGYRSYHIILRVPVHLADRVERVYAEVQLRTIAMDCWASLEHSMRYKKDIKNTALIERELKRCADEIASTDLTLQTIRELINKGDEDSEIAAG